MTSMVDYIVLSKMFKKQKAFTLIEIIVVLIILGLLAAIAVPAYFSWIQRSQAAGALAEMNSMKTQFVTCLRAHQGSEASCFDGTFCIGNACTQYPINPNPPPWYTMSNVYCSSYGNCDQSSPNHLQGWMIMASYPPQPASEQVVISGNSDDTQTVCYGNGAFKGVC